MMEEVGVCAIGMLPLRCILGGGVYGIDEVLFAPLVSVSWSFRGVVCGLSAGFWRTLHEVSLV